MIQSAISSKAITSMLDPSLVEDVYDDPDLPPPPILGGEPMPMFTPSVSGLSEADMGKGSGYVMVYPAYLNSKYTIAQGRRVSKSITDCIDPYVAEMAEACKVLGLRCEVQRKVYSRRWWEFGRLRVQLEVDGKPCHPDIRDRKTLFTRIAEIVPKLDSYKKKIEDHAQRKAEQDKRLGAKILGSTGASTASKGGEPVAAEATSGSSKKSNKKKGRK